MFIEEEIAPSITFAFYPTNVHWSAGIAQLSAICKQWGIRTNLVMLDWFTAPEEFNPPSNLVAFSVIHDNDYRACVPFMRRAKELGKTVLLGGVWAGLGKAVDDSADLVCRGDGEELPAYILGGDEKMFRERLVTEDLNSLPPIDHEIFHGVRFDRCLGPFAGKSLMPYISSRGCTGACTFCQVRFQPGRRVRTKVEEDLLPVLGQYRPDGIYFADAQLPYDNDAWKASWGDLHVPFGCYIRADISESDLEWLIDRGLQAVAFGVESGDEGVRNRLLHKGLTDAQIERTVGILRDHRIFYIPFYISGIPGEGWIGQTRTVKAIKHLGGAPVVWKYEDLSGV